MKNFVLRKFNLIIATIFIAAINAQELDETFMSSLPDDLKKDILTRTNDQNENTNDVYNSYQYSSKLEQKEELSKLKKRLEEDLIELEMRLRGDEKLLLDEGLKLYGLNFFNTFQTSFMPINEPNPDSTYTLDVGDVLSIQLVGQKEYEDNFPINRDGAVNLPDIGMIVLAGLSLNQADRLIQTKIEQAYIGTEAFVSLDRIRDINILVTGNASNPGIYTLTGNSNILHALSAAGGISKFGSLREIKLIRNDQTIETLDIYDLLIDGKYNLNTRLRSGDVVFVEATKKIVTIDGAVKRPAKYEVLDEQNLADVIRYANGIKRTADIQNISVERILDGTLKTIPVVNEKQLKTINASDGDLIYVREFSYREAKISGAIQKPGYYTMANGETLYDLIQKAGGYNKNAYPFGAIFLNENAKLINQKSMDILYKEFLDNLIAASQQNISENFDLTPIVSLTAEIKNSEPNGRIIVDLLDENRANLVSISDGDELFIPELNNNVYIYGEISTEGAVMYEDGKDVKYFVSKSGGYKKFADINSIYVLHPNGEAQRYSQKRHIFESKPESELEIYPGSIIFVPRKLDNSTTNRLAAQAYVSILGNLGIALASLSSINNN